MKKCEKIVKHFTGFSYGIANMNQLTVLDSYDDTIYKYETKKELLAAWDIVEA